MILLTEIEFERVNSKIREDAQINKRKICMKVKKILLSILIYAQMNVFQWVSSL
jgi:hypothetical protein